MSKPFMMASLLSYCRRMTCTPQANSQLIELDTDGCTNCAVGVAPDSTTADRDRVGCLDKVHIRLDAALADDRAPKLRKNRQQLLLRCLLIEAIYEQIDVGGRPECLAEELLARAARLVLLESAASTSVQIKLPGEALPVTDTCSGARWWQRVHLDKVVVVRLAVVHVARRRQEARKDGPAGEQYVRP
eukprot:2755699-Prymnesium_polylepis.1